VRIAARSVLFRQLSDLLIDLLAKVIGPITNKLKIRSGAYRRIYVVEINIGGKLGEENLVDRLQRFLEIIEASFAIVEVDSQ
tara:strand:- start:86 stop:331 length:246 start_codon:yes stop_codon:yes gene_type:complete